MANDGFGKANYEKEELTAITSAYLCAVKRIGQPSINNSAVYIPTWWNVLGIDKTLIIKAALQAQKATEYCECV